MKSTSVLVFLLDRQLHKKHKQHTHLHLMDPLISFSPHLPHSPLDTPLFFSTSHVFVPSARLEEVLEAQKDRDQALMSRLLLANEERDEALLRVRRLQQAAEYDFVLFVVFLQNRALRSTTFLFCLRRICCFCVKTGDEEESLPPLCSSSSFSPPWMKR